MAAPPSLPSTPSVARPTRARHLLLAALCSLAFLTYLDRICIMRVQEEMANDLNFGQLTSADEEALRDQGHQQDTASRQQRSQQRTKERLSWVFSAFLLGYVLFEVPVGWLGDVWGSRLVITLIVLWWSLFTALTGSVGLLVGWFTADPGPWILVGILAVIRFLFGLGEAGAFPNVGRVVGHWFPFRERGSAQGVIWMASRLGGAASPAIIGALMAWAGGWQEAFGVLGLIGFLWAVPFFMFFRDRPEDSFLVNAAERAVIRAGQADTGSVLNSHAGVPWLQLLFSPSLWAIYLAAFAISFSWYFYVTFFPSYLKDRFDVDFAQSEFMTGLPLLIGSISCLAGGRLSDLLIRRTGSRRWGRSLIGLVGLTGAGLCVLVVPCLGTAWQVSGAICLACAFQDLAVPILWAVCADVGQRYAGTVGGCMNAVGGVGGALSPLLAARIGWGAIFFVYAASYFCGGLLWLAIDAARTIRPADNIQV